MDSSIIRKKGSGRLKQRRSKSKSSKFLTILSVACAALFLLALALGVKVAMNGREVTDLTVLQRKQAQKLAILEPKLAEMEEEIAALVQSRLPHLTALGFDKVLPVDKKYVKNIAFTLAGKGGKKRYEYKMVMDNRSLVSVHPHVQIIFFDKVGIQVGMSELGVDTDGMPTLDVLERGEIRSHVSQVKLTDNTDPQYFAVRIKTGF
ncbi:MAG: hypothetical protein V3V31_02050 [Methylococcales bacterium]